MFDNKLIFQVGKMNPAGNFDAVLYPVAVNNPKLQDTDISVLIMVPPGINPTMLGRLPIYPNTAWGATVPLPPQEPVCVLRNF